ncbi:hypothetical protein APV28_3650 [Comamonas testosteroni]|nr:hypothetical protein APV28_3650 [Comamonas testosteroni]
MRHRRPAHERHSDVQARSPASQAFQRHITSIHFDHQARICIMPAANLLMCGQYECCKM